MLKSFKILGFKSIRQAELQLGRVNIFIGGNGSGKSNILEAFGILSASLKDISDIELQRRGVRLSVPTLFKSAFRNITLKKNFNFEAEFENDVNYKVGIQAGENSTSLRIFSEQIKHNNLKYMGRSHNGVTVSGATRKKDIDPTRGLWDRFRETIDLPDELSQELNRMAKFAIYAPQTAFLRGTDLEGIPVSPLGLQGGRLPQAASTVMDIILNKRHPAQHLLREVFSLVFKPGWTDSFIVEARDPTQVPSQVKSGESVLYFIDKFMTAGPNKRRNKLSAYDSSEGTLYLLFMATLLCHPESPKIFGLDNIDNALNPSITTALLKTIIRATCGDDFRSLNVGPDQVFLTSHNPTSLDAFDIFSEDQRIFVVYRNKDTGETKVRRLQPQKGMAREDWIKLSAGKNLSELWIEGKIRGALGL